VIGEGMEIYNWAKRSARITETGLTRSGGKGLSVINKLEGRTLFGKNSLEPRSEEEKRNGTRPAQDALPGEPEHACRRIDKGDEAISGGAQRGRFDRGRQTIVEGSSERERNKRSEILLKHEKQTRR